MTDHVEYLRRVFRALQENQLYVWSDKCEFEMDEVGFLGHIMGNGKIHMELGKIKAIVKWEAPKSPTEVRSFLGLSNYYRRFVKGYSAIAVPLTNLLRKELKWEWTPECQADFDTLNEAIRKSRYSHFLITKPFEVMTDASDLAVGGVPYARWTPGGLRAPQIVRRGEIVADT
ncbi:uncharacterized mitochondrial protein AtMg00860-like [Andrographis paniculata]|uniref:uncharacterized mitochondrial protein AtMg00860-like n=1 Tax=Andrographis paniculata TaxID=175694 RepID=UPI0021E91B64|nr:uncharacterized mitochondrial protein AtMg00860-like [Andrographis paniculata]